MEPFGVRFVVWLGDWLGVVSWFACASKSLARTHSMPTCATEREGGQREGGRQEDREGGREGVREWTRPTPCITNSPRGTNAIPCRTHHAFR